MTLKKASVEELLSRGAVLSNIAYNVSQGRALTPRDLNIMRQTVKEWDAAARAVRAELRAKPRRRKASR